LSSCRTLLLLLLQLFGLPRLLLLASTAAASTLGSLSPCPCCLLLLLLLLGVFISFPQLIQRITAAAASKLWSSPPPPVLHWRPWLLPLVLLFDPFPTCSCRPLLLLLLHSFILALLQPVS
jgi:hypothetical protein